MSCLPSISGVLYEPLPKELLVNAVQPTKLPEPGFTTRSVSSRARYQQPAAMAGAQTSISVSFDGDGGRRVPAQGRNEPSSRCWKALTSAPPPAELQRSSASLS